MVASVKSADRALELLEALAARPRGLTFSEVCEGLSLPKSSGHALLATMTKRRFVEFDEPRRRYQLGIRTWETGQSYLVATDLERMALPHMKAVRDEVNEVVHLAILDGVENVYVARVEADQQIVLASRVGARLPAYATGVGKALLSGLSDDEVRARFAGVVFERFSPKTLRGAQELIGELAAVRRQGFAVDRGEHTTGVHCVAVPVRDHTGGVRAALSISAPAVRMPAARRPAMVGILVRHAAQLSAVLGSPPRV